MRGADECVDAASDLGQFVVAVVDLIFIVASFHARIGRDVSGEERGRQASVSIVAPVLRLHADERTGQDNDHDQGERRLAVSRQVASEATKDHESAPATRGSGAAFRRPQTQSRLAPLARVGYGYGNIDLGGIRGLLKVGNTFSPARGLPSLPRGDGRFQLGAPL